MPQIIEEEERGKDLILLNIGESISL